MVLVNVGAGNPVDRRLPDASSMEQSSMERLEGRAFCIPGGPCHGAFPVVPAMGHSPRPRLSTAGLDFEDNVGLGGHPVGSTCTGGSTWPCR